jgi:hypothetical protein
MKKKREMDRQTYGQLGRQRDEQKDEQIDGQTKRLVER